MSAHDLLRFWVIQAVMDCNDLDLLDLIAKLMLQTTDQKCN